MDLSTQYKIAKNFDDGYNIKDDYHSMSELYYNRMILFLTICKLKPELSWRSFKHHDDTMFDDYFVAGINTPEGQLTYHYNKKYWYLFDGIKTLEKSPIYDGHTSQDIGRLLSLID